ncbi:MAG: 50S ribosomal protein L5 [Bacteroidota bacterium]
MAKEKEEKKEKPVKEKPAQEKPAKEKSAAKGKKETGAQEKGSPARLLEQYKKSIVPALMAKFQYKNPMQVPRLEKISINIGVGDATQDPKLLDVSIRELEAITGQKCAITKSKKAISNFKLRENLPIGCRVTLRRMKMYEFLDRFVSVALPRVRDFRGVPDKSFDGHGNYTMGVKEQIIFPEIDVDKITRVNGMDITFVTTAKNDVEAYELLRALGIPFVKREEVIQSAPGQKK